MIEDISLEFGFSNISEPMDVEHEACYETFKPLRVSTPDKFLNATYTKLGRFNATKTDLYNSLKPKPMKRKRDGGSNAKENQPPIKIRKKFENQRDSQLEPVSARKVDKFFLLILLLLPVLRVLRTKRRTWVDLPSSHAERPKGKNFVPCSPSNRMPSLWGWRRWRTRIHQLSTQISNRLSWEDCVEERSALPQIHQDLISCVIKFSAFIYEPKPLTIHLLIDFSQLIKLEEKLSVEIWSELDQSCVKICTTETFIFANIFIVKMWRRESNWRKISRKEIDEKFHWIFN